MLKSTCKHKLTLFWCVLNMVWYGAGTIDFVDWVWRPVVMLWCRYGFPIELQWFAIDVLEA